MNNQDTISSAIHILIYIQSDSVFASISMAFSIELPSATLLEVLVVPSELQTKDEVGEF